LPTSPLFPYTTLFRSPDRGAGDGAVLPAVQRGDDGVWAAVWRCAVGQVYAGGCPAAGVAGGRWGTGSLSEEPEDVHSAGRIAGKDRKSTRLNSSHVKI